MPREKNMRFEILTLFPEMFAPLYEGILGKAVQKGLFELNITDIREFSEDKHKKCDDAPFGGGAGMVMTPQPLHSAVLARDPAHKCKRIYLSPKGKTLTQKIVKELAECENLMLVCGGYEGVDERFIEKDIDELISVGDYILTGGELAAMVVVNCVSRYVKGVLGSEQSVQDESFEGNLLEYPHYTRPAVWENMPVPEVILSGNHAEIEKWRAQKKIEETRKHRPDLLHGINTEKRADLLPKE